MPESWYIAEAQNGFANAILVVNDEKKDEGIVTVLWFGTEDVRGDGDVYYLTFEILEAKDDATTDVFISFEENDNANVSGENLIFTPINGSVDIRTWWLGDLNGDRKYAMADLLLLAQYVSGKEMNFTDKQLLSADVNEDGTIDIHDVIMLQQWLLNEEI